eukprot:927677-Rhodomonas_salina.13
MVPVGMKRRGIAFPASRHKTASCRNTQVRATSASQGRWHVYQGAHRGPASGSPAALSRRQCHVGKRCSSEQTWPSPPLSRQPCNGAGGRSKLICSGRTRCVRRQCI